MSPREINGYQCARCGRLYYRLNAALSCDHKEVEEE